MVHFKALSHFLQFKKAKKPNFTPHFFNDYHLFTNEYDFYPKIADEKQFCLSRLSFNPTVVHLIVLNHNRVQFYQGKNPKPFNLKIASVKK